MGQQVTSVGTPLFYIIFFVVILVMIAIDLLALKKKGVHTVSVKEALFWSAMWVVISLVFAGWLYYVLASDPLYGSGVAFSKTLEFLTGYVLEKALAVDNIFVFVMIFSYFNIPPQYQQRVLLYGVLGAIVLRAVMVGLGAVLVREFEWILYLFGLFLVYTAWHMFRSSDEEKGLEDNKLIAYLSRRLPLAKQLDGEKFFTRENGRHIATPLFLVLVMVELSDLVFSIDSIPAIFAVTTDPFIVLTSNLFAILGLRAMYFLLADVVQRFVFLKYGLALVLLFIGVKMLIIKWIHIPVALSLAVVFVALLLAVIASLLYGPRDKV